MGANLMSLPFWQMMSSGPYAQAWPAAGVARSPLSLVSPKIRKKMNTGPCPVEIVDVAGAEAVADEWQALLPRALEANIFMEPAFALAAAQHLAEAQRPRFMLVRDGTDGTLLAVWSIENRPRALVPHFVQTWLGLQAVLGTPVIDRTRASAVIEAVLQALALRNGTRTILLVPHIPRCGPTYGLLVSHALATGRTWTGLSPHARAALPAAGALPVPKLGKNAARQRRRLEELGSVSVRSATTPEDVRDATEQFLVLEAAGWKGRRATALLSDPGSATFLRAATRRLAAQRQCRIDSLELDGRPIAMAIVLQGAGQAYYWKTSFDETLAAYSPGVQLTADLTRRQLADPAVRMTDSCAIAGHPMIERLWPARREIVDVAIATTPGEPTVPVALGRERLRRRARSWLKRWAKAWAGRVANGPRPTFARTRHGPADRSLSRVTTPTLPASRPTPT